MKAHIKKVVPALLITAFLCLAIPPGAGALSFESLVGENGIEVIYDINRRLNGEITITPQDPWERNIFNLVEIRVAVTDINPNPEVGPPTVNLHYYFRLSYPYPMEFENDLPIPFGEFGIVTDKRSRDFMEINTSNQIDISILSIANTFKYDISLNFEGIYSDRWQGEATFSDAIITEEVIIDTSALTDLWPGGDLPIDIPQELRWDITFIPVFLVGSTNLGLLQVDAFRDGSLTSSIPGDIPYIGGFLSMLPVPLLKGSTHFWFNSGNF
jgi:hypothetical protein